METKIIKFKDIENKPRDEIYNLFYQDENIIELDRCPFCGYRSLVYTGASSTQAYGWCPNCDAQGPKHWDWIIAGKMWNCRNDEKAIKKLLNK